MLNNVLVIDDSRLDRFIVEKLIERSQLAGRVIPMEMAREGLSYITEALQNGSALPEVIFLDINMPEMSGFEFLDEFNHFPDELKQNCSIVMLSSSLDQDDYNKAMSYAFVKMYCNKPLNMAKLEELKLMLLPQ